MHAEVDLEEGPEQETLEGKRTMGNALDIQVEMREHKFTVSQNLLSYLTSFLLKSIRLTLRWKEDGFYDSQENHWSVGKPVIVVFWHSQQLFMPWIYRRAKTKAQKPFYAIVSQHRDGRLCASLLEKLSIKTIAGSSSNGGRRAFIEMSQQLKSGSHIAITPDGPKGPAEEAKLGAVKLASLTGASIVPVAFNAQQKWTFNSWDSLFLPKPFSKTYILMGKEIQVKKGISKTDLILTSEMLTETLNNLNSKVSSELN